MILYNNADAQVNSNTLESIVNQTGSLNDTPQINVDGSPQYIFGDLSSSDTIYVANYKGESRNGTVSAIDTTTYNTIDIPVGIYPTYIFGDLTQSNLIYVANRGADIDSAGTVSVINTANNTVIEEIPVGDYPTNIFGDLTQSDAIYVANLGSDGISMINSRKNEVVAGVTFEINPSRSGNIVCDTNLGGLDAPINRFLYLSSGTNCIAKPNKGFEFSSWGEILDGNSTRTINSTSGSPWTAFLM